MALNLRVHMLMSFGAPGTEYWRPEDMSFLMYVLSYSICPETLVKDLVLGFDHGVGSVCTFGISSTRRNSGPENGLSFHCTPRCRHIPPLEPKR